jgi:hypothetical protein
MDLIKRLLAIAPAGPRIEMGVFRGATLAVISQHSGETIGVDSFAGMAEPTARDMPENHNPYPKGRLACPMEVVMKTAPGVRLIRGYVPSVLADVPDQPYAFARLDMDHYEPTRAALDWLWPRMMTGGILSCDDYFADNRFLASGAINEFCDRHPIVGHEGREAWFVK